MQIALFTPAPTPAETLDARMAQIRAELAQAAQANAPHRWARVECWMNTYRVDFNAAGQPVALAIEDAGQWCPRWHHGSGKRPPAVLREVLAEGHAVAIDYVGA